MAGRLRVAAKSALMLYAGITSLTNPQVARGGVNVWTSHGPGGADVYALAIDPTLPTTLYLGTLDGVFKSTEQARSKHAPARRPIGVRTQACHSLCHSTPFSLDFQRSALFRSAPARRRPLQNLAPRKPRPRGFIAGQ